MLCSFWYEKNCLLFWAMTSNFVLHKTTTFPLHLYSSAHIDNWLFDYMFTCIGAHSRFKYQNNWVNQHQKHKEGSIFFWGNKEGSIVLYCSLKFHNHMNVIRDHLVVIFDQDNNIWRLNRCDNILIFYKRFLCQNMTVREYNVRSF